MVRVRSRVPIRHAAACAFAVATGLLSTSCRSHETGPALSIEVEGETLVPSSSEPNASSLCCCRVRGTVRNTSSITIHANLNFDAGGAAGPLGTALDWVPNIAPGAGAPFVAVGISAPCSQVTTITGRHFLTGVYIGSGGS
ncbi:MAG TPA: hypothetical protein VFM88_16000 [Vicinamibacteria bacterium]|nr:hypothetical protein [Vicinamibacteria bacterium]